MTAQPTRPMLTPTMVCALLALVFIGLLAAVKSGITGTFDRSVSLALHSLSTPWLDRLAILVTDAASQPAIIGILLVIAAVFIRRHRTPQAARLVAAVTGAAVTTAILKLLIARVRPELWPRIVHEASLSFPSGHATASSALAAAVTIMAWHTPYRRPVLIFGVVYVVLVGLSRIYLGVHYSTDVLAGWCVGIFWAVAASAYMTDKKNTDRD